MAIEDRVVVSVFGTFEREVLVMKVIHVQKHGDATGCGVAEEGEQVVLPFVGRRDRWFAGFGRRSAAFHANDEKR